MATTWQKLGLTVAGTVLSVGLIEAQPAQAASFPSSLAIKAGGSLTFENSPLTGIGQETVDLSNLQGVTFGFNYSYENLVGGSSIVPYYYSDDYGYPPESNINFSFDNGNLIGIEFFDDALFRDDLSLGGGGGYVANDLTIGFLAKGDRFAPLVSGSQTSASYNGVVETGYEFDHYEYYYDENGNLVEYPVFRDFSVSSYGRREENYSYQIEETGIREQRTGFEGVILEYSYDGGEETRTEDNTQPINENIFTPFSELPLITFNTIDPVPQQPVSVPETNTNPFIIFSATTALAFGVFSKNLQRKKIKI